MFWESFLRGVTAALIRCLNEVYTDLWMMASEIVGEVMSQFEVLTDENLTQRMSDKLEEALNRCGSGKGTAVVCYSSTPSVFLRRNFVEYRA